MADLLCPKCRVQMTSLERNGVTLERCTECGGIFLDRGELERLEEAEAAGLQSAAPGQGAAPAGSGNVQSLVGELLSLARQYRGRSRF